MATMVSYTSRMHLDPVDPVAIGHYWADLLDVMLDRCRADRELLPADQSIDIRFDDFMADTPGTIERIYQLADQPFAETTRTAMADYLAEHGRSRHGGLIYDLADFDLDRGELRDRFSAYTDAFAITLEP